MPYFVYRISAEGSLTLIESFASYREAKRLATDLRHGASENEQAVIRIIFASDPLEAERLLTSRRERRPSEDD